MIIVIIALESNYQLHSNNTALGAVLFSTVPHPRGVEIVLYAQSPPFYWFNPFDYAQGFTTSSP
jgi:hypothetical protein